MKHETIECPEIAGKTIQALTIHDDPAMGREVHLEFTDGTMFSIEVEVCTSVKARHYRGGVGTLETLSLHDG